MMTFYSFLSKHVPRWSDRLRFIIALLPLHVMTALGRLFLLIIVKRRTKFYEFALLSALVSILKLVFISGLGYGLGIILSKVSSWVFLTGAATPTLVTIIERITYYQPLITYAMTFSPLPFGLLTISTGAMGLSFQTLFSYALIARIIKGLINALCFYLCHQEIDHYLVDYFYLILWSSTLGYALWTII